MATWAKVLLIVLILALTWWLWIPLLAILFALSWVFAPLIIIALIVIICVTAGKKKNREL